MKLNAIKKAGRPKKGKHDKRNVRVTVLWTAVEYADLVAAAGPDRIVDYVRRIVSDYGSRSRRSKPRSTR